MAAGSGSVLLSTHMSPLTVDVLDALEPVAGEWGELAARVHAAPFLYPGWTRAWASAFGAGKPRIFAASRGGELVGLVPMQLRRGTLLSPTNEHTPAFDLLALDDDALSGLANAIFAAGAREVSVAPLDAGGRAVEALCIAARGRGYRVVVRQAGRSPYLRLGADLPAHERALSRNLRHDVRRRLRRLCEAGAVSVQVLDGGARLEALLAEGFAVEQLSWKGGRGTAIASGERTSRFYREAARWGVSNGWLRLAFLRLDGRPIAFQFDLEAGATYYSLKIGYDPAFERFSPGKLLAYTMVSRAVVKGISSYELLGTDEPWKYRWTEDVRERLHFRAFAGSPAGRVAWSAAVHGRPLLRRVPFAQRLGAALRS
jgi:CelD/BcsL family acetyltransferase involved in cellulose biosynthesis